MKVLTEIFYLVWNAIKHPSTINIVTSTTICRCAFCKSPFNDTNSLDDYAKRLEKIIEKQKSVLREIESIPCDILPRIFKVFDVAYADAVNKKHNVEVLNERRIESETNRARSHYWKL